MTENEAIKEIETSLELAEMCKLNREREKEIKAYKMAIQALEKVQQFESIGTVEEFKDLKEFKKTITEIVDRQLIAGSNNYKETYDCFHEIAKVVQDNY